MDLPVKSIYVPHILFIGFAEILLQVDFSHSLCKIDVAAPSCCLWHREIVHESVWWDSISYAFQRQQQPCFQAGDVIREAILLAWVKRHARFREILQQPLESCPWYPKHKLKLPSKQCIRTQVVKLNGIICFLVSESPLLLTWEQAMIDRSIALCRESLDDCCLYLQHHVAQQQHVLIIFFIERHVDFLLISRCSYAVV